MMDLDVHSSEAWTVSHCHLHPWSFFADQSQVMIDNLKSVVDIHREKALFNPRYLDFAAHHGLSQCL